jgi:hypothetical protein
LDKLKAQQVPPRISLLNVLTGQPLTLTSEVQVIKLEVPGVPVDEVLPRAHRIAHQERKHLVRLGRIIDRHLSKT